MLSLHKVNSEGKICKASRSRSRLAYARAAGSEIGRLLASLEQDFYIRRPGVLQGVRADDVITAGATLEAAAKVLKQAGAQRVKAIVFARA